MLINVFICRATVSFPLKGRNLLSVLSADRPHLSGRVCVRNRVHNKYLLNKRMCNSNSFDKKVYLMLSNTAAQDGIPLRSNQSCWQRWMDSYVRNSISEIVDRRTRHGIVLSHFRILDLVRQGCMMAKG